MNDAPTLILDGKAQRMIDEMIDAEACHLAQRRAREECACKEGMFPDRAPTDRRAFLLAAGSTAGATAVLGSTARAADQKAPPGAQYFSVPADPAKELGRAFAAGGVYGSRSQFESEVRWRYPTANKYTSSSMTPLDKMIGKLTASGLHFERHHGGIPTIDPSRHVEQAHVGDGMLLVVGGERGIGGARSATAGLRGGNRRSHVVRGNETLACGEKKLNDTEDCRKSGDSGHAKAACIVQTAFDRAPRTLRQGNLCTRLCLARPLQQAPSTRFTEFVPGRPALRAILAGRRNGASAEG